MSSGEDDVMRIACSGVGRSLACTQTVERARKNAFKNDVTVNLRASRGREDSRNFKRMRLIERRVLLIRVYEMLRTPSMNFNDEPIGPVVTLRKEICFRERISFDFLGTAWTV